MDEQADSLTKIQAERNAGVVDSWDIAREHRDLVTGLILAAADEASVNRDNPALCVLGAGNANDIDLPRLGERFARVTLVDVDGDALARGLKQQGCGGRSEFHLYGDCDVTGVWPTLSRIRENAGAGDQAAVEALMRAIPAWDGLPHLGRFDVVASTCVLSQLVEGALLVLGEGPTGVEAAIALRLRHLKLISEMLADGGQGLLITDFVSSATNPNLPSVPAEQLPAVLSQMINAGNCFTALHPYRILATLNEDPWLASHVRTPGCMTPWLWNFGPRHYAVTAIPITNVAPKADPG